MEIAIFIAIIFLIIVNILPTFLAMVAPKPIKTLNFENDILFLNFLIGTKVDHYKQYILAPAKASGVPLMTDEDLNKYREGYIIEIYEHMNKNYIENLYKYFSEEGLRFYISSTINKEITKQILAHNIKFFNKQGTEQQSANGVTKQAVDME